MGKENEVMGITVIDSIMGSGKTSYAIQMINENPEISYIYCTPFLDEVKRMRESCNRDFKEPQYKGGRKLDDFNSLLLDGRDIVVTHSTFANANQETMELIENGEYVLILDETLDILIDFNEVATNTVGKADVKMLLQEGFISYDKYGRVTWLKNHYPDTRYYDIERFARNGNLFYLDGAMLVWQFPPQIFGLFKKVVLLTYMFNGSFLKPYFEYHKIPYDLAGIRFNNGKYELTAYYCNYEQQKDFQNLIDILDDKKMNDYNAAALSKSWFMRQNKNTLKKLQNNIYNYLRNITKAKAESILWTAPKDYRDTLKGRGYNIVRQLTPEEKQLPIAEREKIEKKLKCFLPCNARATNDYADRSVLVYAFNMYCNPYTKRYFENKNQNDGTNITINQDYLALSCMLQWIWRSQIRNGKPIKIYIPSTRMRKLLIAWLNGEM